MKLVCFDNYKVGVLQGDAVYDVSTLVDTERGSADSYSMNRLIARFHELGPQIEKLVKTGKSIPLSNVRLGPPVPHPSNIVCMALNYFDGKIGTSPAPIDSFLKTKGSIIGSDDTMILPDFPALAFEGEAEMAVVIGKQARNVAEAEAMEYVFGYMNFIDGSARGASSLYQMKARETFAPIGPYLVTADEIADPYSLNVRLWVNGDLRQDFNTASMAHKISKSIAWVSSMHTLEPGDIIATGTSHDGLSSFQHGDVVELETEGMGKLRIKVRDDLNRTWERDQWLERRRKGIPEDANRQLTGKYAPVRN